MNPRRASPILLADCSAAPTGNQLPRTNHDALLLVVKTLLGWVSDSERFTKALDAPAGA